MHGNYCPWSVIGVTLLLIPVQCGGNLFSCIQQGEQTESPLNSVPYQGGTNISYLTHCTLNMTSKCLESFVWKRDQEILGRCNVVDTGVCNYTCYPLPPNGQHFEFGTCGPYCLSFAIKLPISPDDFAKFYISARQIESALALNLTGSSQMQQDTEGSDGQSRMFVDPISDQDKTKVSQSSVSSTISAGSANVSTTSFASIPSASSTTSTSRLKLVSSLQTTERPLSDLPDHTVDGMVEENVMHTETAKHGLAPYGIFLICLAMILAVVVCIYFVRWRFQKQKQINAGVDIPKSDEEATVRYIDANTGTSA